MSLNDALNRTADERMPRNETQVEGNTPENINPSKKTITKNNLGSVSSDKPKLCAAKRRHLYTAD